MSQVSFEKKIGNKNVKIHAQTHKSGGDELWGVSHLCPWCGQIKYALGCSTPKKAALKYWNILESHYKANHK